MKTQEKLVVRIDDIIRDLVAGTINESEAKQQLLSVSINDAFLRLSNMCKEVKKMRDKQNTYFLTRDSKILRETKQLEKALDEKIATLLRLEQERLNPKLPL